MLELRNVTKIYHSKSGNDVRALDNVSVTFPETGMVFILGKSGSGKSTLLNVIGGLDGCDSGEFIIKGKSSTSFAGSDFDAYRNTFIGFIFQEYNILDDFTVGANIALALELQGKKATNEQINSILAQVEMLEYAKRKPNELSGGQKQRIAIARALVKDPEIIMADEPTGALDSNTGKQIFDTLKQLSKTKLVIIVSHDRDFAERYGDRIIEMMDGRIYSDVTKHEVQSKSVSHGILQMGENLLKIEKGYQLTPDDVKLINEYLLTRETDVIVSGDARLNENVRNVAGISADNTTAVFNYTNPATDIPVRAYDGSKTSFIRSRLPMKNAVKMGASSLKNKVFRLVTTIFLSLIAFALFGFADTMGSYDKVTATTQSIIDSGVKNASFSLGVKEEQWYDGKLQNINYVDASFNDNDVSALSQKLGVNFMPVFNGSQNINKEISLARFMKNTVAIDSSLAYKGTLAGFATLSADDITRLGFSYVGKLPENSEEIAISKFIYDQFKLTGFKSDDKEINADDLNMNENDPNSIIGKQVELDVGHGSYKYKITAVIDTKFDTDRYQKYIPNPDDHSQDNGNSNGKIDPMEMVLINELDNTLKYGYHCLGYVTKNAVTKMSSTMEKYYSESEYLGDSMHWQTYLTNDSADLNEWLYRGANSSVLNKLNVTYFDSSKTTLGKTEILLPKERINRYINEQYDAYSKIVDVLNDSEYYGQQQSQEASEIIREIALKEYAKQFLNDNRSAVEAAFGGGTVDDSILISYIAEQIIPAQSIPGLKTESEIVGALYKKLFTAVFGIDFTKFPNVTDTHVYTITQYDNIFGGTLDGSYYIDYGRFESVICDLYAYNAVYAPGSTMHLDNAFLDIVLYPYDDNEEIKSTYLNVYSTEMKLNEAVQAYTRFINWYNYEGSELSYGDISSDQADLEARSLFSSFCTVTYSEEISQLYLTTTTYDNNGNEVKKDYKNYTIVGFFETTDYNRELIVCDDFYDAWCKYRDDEGYSHYKYAPHDNGIYTFLIAPMPESKADIRKFVELGYKEGGDTAFILQNQVTNNLEFYNDFIEMGSTIFVFVGLGFALFAAFMMMNFISTSISYKRREIGILRAVGARSSDVFKIFFSEALIIAAINYVLSTIATVAAILVLNNMVRNLGIQITLLSFGIRQVILMLLISVAVALIASFLPVWNIARRKPVDAIKNT